MGQNSQNKNLKECAEKHLSKSEVQDLLSKKDKIVKSGKVITK